MQRDAAIVSYVGGFWPDATVYYDFDPAFTDDRRSIATAAMQTWTDRTHVQFVYWNGKTPKHVTFFNADGISWSQVGALPNGNTIGMAPDMSSALHEIGHTLGLLQEQCRHDRDSAIAIHLENVDPNCGPEQFAKMGNQELDVGPFDWNSIMLYGSYTCSSGGPTMTRLDGSTFDGGSTISDWDAYSVAAWYRCLDDGTACGSDCGDVYACHRWIWCGYCSTPTGP